MSVVEKAGDLSVRPDIALAARLFDELRARTGTDAGVTRISYGEGEEIAHAMVRREAEALGLRIETDAAANLYMTLPGREPGPALMIGSHLDSVPRGGNFDGAAGVLMGLSVISGYRHAEFCPPRDLTVMAIRAEESTWFNASYIGSRAAFGRLAADELDALERANDGRSLGDAIAACGGDVPALRRGAAFLDPARIAAFIEPHIEQGPRLVGSRDPFGIVTGIRGSFRYRRACCHGVYAHSGATPREVRRDAVSAVAALIVEMNALWSALEAEGEDLAITFGQLATDAAEHAFSKVAGRVDASLDVRSQSTETLDRVWREMQAIVAHLERAYHVTFDLGPRTGSDPAPMSEGVIAALARAAASAGFAAPLLPCGAGHDAAVFASLGVPTGMIFIRNENGSHNPREAMAIEDFTAAAEVLSCFCLMSHEDLR